MDVVGTERGRWDRAAHWLEASRAELAGLLVLLVGAAAATGALWWAALGPAAPSPAATGIGTPVTDDGPTGDAVPSNAGHDVPVGDPEGGDTARQPGGPEQVTVHVTGAVAAPGVVTVAGGSRVADAIAAAGGLDDDAEPGRLNLARMLEDGEQVHVLREGEEPPPEAAGGEDDGLDAHGRVDLNRADEAALETLPGIGPARAAAIVEHRATHGPFAEPGDLRAVPGIGEVTFQRVADLVVVP